MGIAPLENALNTMLASKPRAETILQWDKQRWAS